MISRILLLCVLAFSAYAAIAQDSDFEPVDLPDFMTEKVANLSDDKVEYIRGPRIFQFAGSHDLLFRRFRNKTSEEIESYIDAMIRVQELSAFDPDTDMASIPLNTEDSGFNGWKVLRPKEFDTPREDGPININRYLREGAKLGIPTFFNLPIALTPEDLLAGEIDVAIMGIGLDTGTGFRGAAYGPRALRTSNIYGGTGMNNLPHMHTQVSPFNELSVVDYGDVNVDQLSLERSLDHIRTMVREVAAQVQFQ